MPKTWTTIMCITVLFTTYVPGSAQGKSTEQADASASDQELVALQKAFLAAQERGDAEYVKNAVATGFTAIETNGETADRADFIRVRPEEKPAEAPMLYDFRVIQLGENCAVVTYNGVFSSNLRERYQHVSDVWMKDDGNWKLKFQQVTLNLWSAHD